MSARGSGRQVAVGSGRCDSVRLAVPDNRTTFRRRVITASSRVSDDGSLFEVHHGRNPANTDMTNLLSCGSRVFAQ